MKRRDSQLDWLYHVTMTIEGLRSITARRARRYPKLAAAVLDALGESTRLFLGEMERRELAKRAKNSAGLDKVLSNVKKKPGGKT